MHTPLLRPHWWLLGVGVILVSLHLVLVARAENSDDLLPLSALVWAGGIYLGWRSPIPWRRDWPSTLVALPIFMWLLIRSLSPHALDVTFLRFYPPLIWLVFALLTGGWPYLLRQRQIGLVLSLTAIPPGLLYKLADWPLLVANTAHVVLHFLGFQVNRLGLYEIAIGPVPVRVDESCSGINIIHLLWAIAVVWVFILPTTRWQKIVLPLLGVAIAFLVNALRVAFLAAVVVNKPMFDYWHTGSGSQLYSPIAVAAFVVCCKFLLQRAEHGQA